MSGAVLLAAGCAGLAAALLVQPVPSPRRRAAAPRPALPFVRPPLALLLSRWRGRRAATAERAGALAACAALAGELRAGRDPAVALGVAADAGTGPLATSLRAAAAAARLGGDVPAALAVGGPSAVPEVRRALAACWTVCAGSGSGLAAAFERLEEGLRAAAAARRAVDAETAGPRATAVVLALLPGAGLLLAAGLGADPLGVLLGTPVGIACLVVGLGLDGLGVWWTGRLVDRALRTV